MKQRINSVVIIVGLMTLVMTFSLLAQTGGTKAEAIEIPVDKKMKLEIIDSISAALNEVYVFPKKAKEMEKFLNSQYKKKQYDEITDLRDFAKKLSEDLLSISNDRHLGIRYASPEYLKQYQSDTLTDAAKIEQEEYNRFFNFGFNKIERLSGNVGYLDLREFADACYAGGIAVAAMNFLSNSDAIIFDLRQNGGGSPSMIQLISSYLFDELTHLNSFYIRKSDTTEQFYTQSWVNGPKMPKADIYVLTSNYTFSAAEEFTYNLKNLKRATIIGETTGGGAHPIEGRYFNNLNIGMSLPFGRAVNPITGTNWEGTGIEPHINVPAPQALDRAHLEALKKLKGKTKHEKKLFAYNWAIDGLEAQFKPVELTEEVMQSYVGKYGPRIITFENGQLYYQREGRDKYMMIPIKPNLFGFEEIEYFRLEVVVDKNGKSTELVGHYDNGHTDQSPKSE